ncbi:MAG: 3'-5' exonuclease domain-containing protein 2 [Bacteroidaceae bacterium]|nr:3'-5' exonuclease domain-containing protein 2 [Bacteroidaceae bacterium]
MKQLLAKFDKRDITALPRTLFEGRIIVIQTEGEAKRAVDYLLTFPRVGIDTETRPTFRRGANGMNPVSLLQVSTDDTCFLFRLNFMGLPPCIVKLLSEQSILKVGLSLHDDWHQLCRRTPFRPQNYVELQDYVKKLGIEDMSLQKLYANIFHQKISKGQQLSNWDADILTDNQKLYAATDAWACLKLYTEIESLLQTGNYKTISQPYS